MSVAITNNYQCREAETTATLDDFGVTVDMNNSIG
jgi:hypothetical protein